MTSSKGEIVPRMGVEILPDRLKWIYVDGHFCSAGSIPVELGELKTQAQIKTQKKMWIRALKSLLSHVERIDTIQVILPSIWIRAYRTIHPHPGIEHGNQRILLTYLQQFESKSCFLECRRIKREPLLLECFYLEGAALYLWWKSCQEVGLQVTSVGLAPSLWRAWIEAYTGESKEWTALVVSYGGGGLIVSGPELELPLRCFNSSNFEDQYAQLLSRLSAPTGQLSRSLKLLGFQTDYALHALCDTLPCFIQWIPTQIPKSLQLVDPISSEPGVTWELIWWLAHAGHRLNKC